jgi:hypothetical protein
MDPVYPQQDILAHLGKAGAAFDLATSLRHIENLDEYRT